MNYLFIFTVHVISTCTATKILYVLPDNVSNVNCPSQPCTTLGQYMLDNGSLPVLSDVEYYFLPGEHHITYDLMIRKAINILLTGVSLSPVELVCQSQSYVSVSQSYNVTIRNLMFNQCDGDLFYHFGMDTTAGLVLYECFYCKVENIYILGSGFAGINLLLHSYLNNITINTTINTTITEQSMRKCGARFFLHFVDIEYEHSQDSMSINKLVFISMYRQSCYGYHQVMEILLYQYHYDMSIELCNSKFQNTNQAALYILMDNSSSSLLIKNCTFISMMHHKHTSENTKGLVYGRITTTNVIIRFENCVFYNNTVLALLEMDFFRYDDLCVHPSTVTIKNCDFIENDGALLTLYTRADDCKANIFFSENVNFVQNKAHYIMTFTRMSVYMNGVITVLENIVQDYIMRFKICNVTISKTVMFLSNICSVFIYLISNPYMLIIEHTNIMFINNTIHYQVIVSEAVTSNNYIFPYCIFQYMESTNYKYDVSELITFYIITLSGNKLETETPTYFDNNSPTTQMNNMNDLLTHCKWLPTAVFNGHNPGYINQQIIQGDKHQLIHHKHICYCPHDGEYNCTVDLLGPVYPGQILQVDLCMPQADKRHHIYAGTHAINLPNSTCKLARQTEFINSIGNESKTFNFTIISEAYEACELFLTSLQFIRTAFYVQLLQCPVGFTLQNGKCDCDPFLPPDIDTCYIELSAIRRPANTWITAHTITNNTTNYLISDCPMDYCLPYSTNVNLAHPDLQCQFNRTGILCSQCQHPLSMVFASSRCIKCTNVHILITIIVIVAGIVLVVLLYVLNFTVTIGTINGIIFYANIVSINDSVFLVNDVFKPLRVFISFINMDLGIETCFYNGMDSYAKMCLQLFFPSYLIIIAISIIIASRYSSRMLRLTYSRSFPVLATLFLLSYTGVLRVVLTVLFSYSIITDYPSGDKQIVWSIDASVPLFGIKFTILFITCLLLFLILISFNITLLFRRYLAQFRIVNYLKPLLDAFQASYKDRYYHWIAVHIILRSLFFSLYGFKVKLRLFLACIILVLFSICYGYLQPNKNKLINIQELSLLANLIIIYIVAILNSENIFSVIINFMISVAFIHFCIIILCHFLTYTLHCNAAIKENLVKLWSRRKSNHCSYDVTLLNIPECTYNYEQCQDGLVIDDFK